MSCFLRHPMIYVWFMNKILKDCPLMSNDKVFNEIFKNHIHIKDKSE